MATVELTHTDCWCGLPFAMPTRLYNQCRNNGTTFHCPLGHAITFKETQSDIIRRERGRLKQENARLEDENKNALATANQQRELKLKVERKLKRVQKGVCPCCTRSFQNLARHMQTKHPEETKLQCVT